MSLKHHDRPLLLLAVRCPDAGWLLGRLSLEAALTVWATCSEDPANWDEVEAYWPRYRSEASGESAKSLSLIATTETAISEQLAGDSKWIAVDLAHKRILTSADIQDVGRDAVLLIDSDEAAEHGVPLPIHLPPWWELWEHVDSTEVLSGRRKPLSVPYTDRRLLYGKMLHEFVASRMKMIGAQRFRRLFVDHGPKNKPRVNRNDHDRRLAKKLYRSIVEIHRDWLMTPSAEIAGVRPDASKPRDLLHGGTDWINRLAEGQRVRFQAGLPIVAAPNETLDFARAPMGRDEIVLYYDYCREVIEAGFCAAATGRDVESQIRLMRQAGQEFLDSPHQDGSPPNFSIDCCRRRVPRASGVPIVGMDEVETDHHMADCDCPICNMMASGIFGPSFAHYDGHHLELDGEFAFSLYESMEEWQIEKDAWGDWDDD